MSVLSTWAKVVVGHYPLKAFRSISEGIKPKDDDITAFVRSFILEGVPRAFVRSPIVYDKIRCQISSRLGVLPSHVCLTGSAKLGFSLSPNHWLRKFNSERSDLDFFIVSESLFLRLSDELRRWEEDYRNGTLKPSSVREREYWDENIKRLAGNVARGFINPDHISTHYPWTRKCRYLCEKLPNYVRALPGDETFKSCKFKTSFRVYSSVEAAIRQIKINIGDAISRQ